MQHLHPWVAASVTVLADFDALHRLFLATSTCCVCTAWWSLRRVPVADSASSFSDSRLLDNLSQTGSMHPAVALVNRHHGPNILPSALVVFSP